MQNQANINDLDHFVEEWHDSASSLSVEEYLGLTREQYFLWCDDPKKLQIELDRIKTETMQTDLQDNKDKPGKVG